MKITIAVGSRDSRTAVPVAFSDYEWELPGDFVDFADQPHQTKALQKPLNVHLQLGFPGGLAKKINP